MLNLRNVLMRLRALFMCTSHKFCDSPSFSSKKEKEKKNFECDDGWHTPGKNNKTIHTKITHENEYRTQTALYKNKKRHLRENRLRIT